MHLTPQNFDNALCIVVEDTRIDASIAVQFKDKVRELYADQDGRLILDLKHVDFIDSSGLGALVAVMKTLPPGTRLELASLTPIVQKVIHLTRMDSVFAVHDSVSAAIGAGKSAA